MHEEKHISRTPRSGRPAMTLLGGDYKLNVGFQMPATSHITN